MVLCAVCGAPVGYPNVRYAQRDEEMAALEARVVAARISASAKGSTAVLARFGKAVETSQTVISKSLGDLHAILQNSSALMQAFHPAVRGAQRMPQNNGWDQAREANDSRINPHFFQDLHFGALSLDGRGVPHYGPYAITLRNDRVGGRSTVFEENPVLFNEKHPISRDKPVPFGFRATWGDRAKLAVAKLHHKIDAETPDEEFASILLEPGNVGSDSDFIEVHVYGMLHAKSFEKVIGPVPARGLDKFLWDEVKRGLAKSGATWQEEKR